MINYKINYIDWVGGKCKNFQLINSIEMFFYVTTDDEVAISYNFHSIDFYLWKEIIYIHQTNVTDYIIIDLFDIEQNKIEDLKKIENKYSYYKIIIKSKDFNLYRNINLIIYLSDNKGWDNMNEMIRKNTWS